MEDGEIFIVLRANISHGKRSEILKCARGYIDRKTQFPKSKFIAVIPTVGLMKIINKFTRGYINIPSLLGKDNTTVWCSEFVNRIYLESGILLTPRSKFSSVIYPHDIITSPHLKYVGLFFKENDRSKEVIEKALIKVNI